MSSCFANTAFNKTTQQLISAQSSETKSLEQQRTQDSFNQQVENPEIQFSQHQKENQAQIYDDFLMSSSDEQCSAMECEPSFYEADFNIECQPHTIMG